MKAINEVGNVESTNYAEIVVASVPEPPPNAPTQNFAYTDVDQIRVEFLSLENSNDNGGSTVLGYDLWRDDGQGGDMETLYGNQAATQPNLALHFTDFNVLKGVTYRYAYRARNINGWGDFSGVSYLFAAGVPSKPEAPALTHVHDGSIGL